MQAALLTEQHPASCCFLLAASRLSLPDCQNDTRPHKQSVHAAQLSLMAAALGLQLRRLHVTEARSRCRLRQAHYYTVLRAQSHGSHRPAAALNETCRDALHDLFALTLCPGLPCPVTGPHCPSYAQLSVAFN
jgi:hypothetical protein